VNSPARSGNTLAIALANDDAPRNRAMIDKEFTFVLGALEPEMREIERMVARADRSFLHAAREGVR